MLDTLLISLLLLGLLGNLAIGWLNLQHASQAGRAGLRIEATDQRMQEAQVAEAIREYFLHSGVEVKVSCTRLADSPCFTALIESEPMKRFRLSHIIESTLAEHVRKTCQLELEKIYWRFPVKAALLQGLVAAEALPEVADSEGDERQSAPKVAPADIPIAETVAVLKTVQTKKLNEAAKPVLQGADPKMALSTAPSNAPSNAPPASQLRPKSPPKSPPNLPPKSPQNSAAEPVDDYISEGLVYYKHLPKLEATELSWEKFQEAAATKSPPKSE